MSTDLRFMEADGLLRARGADAIDHPGGNLLHHVRRVAGLLGAWGAEEDLRLAGLCHACYGTDGFAVSLLSLEERPALAKLIGARAEACVYLYASCDRQAVYPRLGQPGPIAFRDRFSGVESDVSEFEASAFVELTAANELDLAMVNAEFANRFGDQLMNLFTRARSRLSSQAWTACTEVLAGARSSTTKA